MKLKKSIIGLFALAGITALAGCSTGEGATSKAPDPQNPTQTSALEPEETSTTEVVPTFEAYTLEQLHAARKAKTLDSLERKTVSIKGKVTYVKRVDDYSETMFIQSGKYALEVSYPEPYSVNVGDSVEAKGYFSIYKTGDISEIKLYTDKTSNSHYDIKVINEAFNVETVTLNNKEDLSEYDSSLANIDFTVTNPSYRSAAFVGNLKEGNDEIIVAPKSKMAENLETPYEEGDKVSYTGVFTFGGNTALVLRYYDRAGFAKKTN